MAPLFMWEEVGDLIAVSTLVQLDSDLRLSPKTLRRLKSEASIRRLRCTNTLEPSVPRQGCLFSRLYEDVALAVLIPYLQNS